MTLSFDRDSLVAFAAPSGRSAPSSASASVFDRAAALRLHDVLAPLRTISPQAPRVLHDRAMERFRLDRLRRRFERESPTVGSVPHDEYKRGVALECERRLRYASQARYSMNRVFEKYGERLPLTWQRWLWWSHRCYEYVLPRDLPALLEGIEALIAVEAQLHVDSQYPNRDHVLHQLADAELAVKLHVVAQPGFDDLDWEMLVKTVPAAERFDRDAREAVTRCGLALAGMFHDIGYLRYVGASARDSLASTFGMLAPRPSIDPWEVMATFAGTYLDRILWQDHDDGTDGLVTDVFMHAWEAGWHGPLSAMVLSSTARRLRNEGRSTAEVEASLQIAAAAAFLHELHALKRADIPAPAAILRARERIVGYAWPTWFRIVDELQCWFRPTLAPCAVPDVRRATLDYGACGAKLEPAIDGASARFVIQATSPAARSRIEDKEVKYLRTLAADQPRIFAALGILGQQRDRKDPSQYGTTILVVAPP